MGIGILSTISQSREWEWNEVMGMRGDGYTKVIPAHLYCRGTGTVQKVRWRWSFRVACTTPLFLPSV